MNKILKISLIAIAGIVFFGASYLAAPLAYAAAPVISSFTVTPNPATSGENLQIKWTSTGADANGCYFSGTPWGAQNSPAQSSSGQYNDVQAINNTAAPITITIKITCDSTTAVPEGIPITESASDQKAIIINPASGLPVITLSTNPAQIPAGPASNMDITWSSSNTKRPNGCTVSGPGWTGAREDHGTNQIPAVAGTYSITCTGPAGSTTKAITVGVASPDPESGPQGQLPPGGGDQNALSNLKCASFTSFNPAGCLSMFVYYVYFVPTSWALYGAAWIFDTALKLSIDKSFVIQPFISELWVIIRNFSNMIFIFVLLYTGISTMLGFGDWKRTVINVVIIALLINFSLFFTKVVIDAGNILAVGVYSSMGKEKPKQVSKGTLPERDITGEIVAGFNPMSFMGNKPTSEPMNAIVIFAVAATVNAFAAYIFFKAALVFLGRLLAFWYLMIVSPFAFTSIVMPKGSIFDSWSKLLIDQAFMAPVFLFLMYLIMKVIASGFLGNFLNQAGSNGNFFFDVLIVPVILAAMILMALQKALKVAEKMGGEFGAAVSSAVGKVVGTVATVAVGAATGGAALAAGKLGASALARGGLQEAAKSSNIIKRSYGKLGLLAADKAQTATFDPRNLGGGIGKGLTSLGLGTGNKMTYEGQTKKWREPQEKRQERLGELMEIPKEKQQQMLAQEAAEAASSKRELADLDRLVIDADNAAKAKEKELGLPEKTNAVEEMKKAAEAASKKEQEAFAELQRILATSVTDANNMKVGEAEARNAVSRASLGVVDANKTHADAKEVLAESTKQYESTDQAKNLTEAKRKHDAQKVISDMKDRDLVKAKQDIEDKNASNREAYATQVARGGFTAGAKARAQERAEKIRSNTQQARKSKKEQKENFEDMVKLFAVEQKKNEKPAAPEAAKPAK